MTARWTGRRCEGDGPETGNGGGAQAPSSLSGVELATIARQTPPTSPRSGPCLRTLWKN
jgi:hypothetical protein